MSRLMIFCLAVSTLHATTARAVLLNAARDATLIQTTATGAGQLASGAGDLIVGRTNQDGQGAPTISIRRGLNFFDIASAGIPANATITNVVLSIKDGAAQLQTGDRQIDLHRVLENWGEGTSYSLGSGATAANNDATWLYTFYNSADPANSPTWSTPGGSFDPTVSASTIAYDNTPPGPLAPPGTIFTWSGPGLITDVQFWLANPGSNFGWMLRGVETAGQTAKRFDSRDTSNEPTNVAPTLLIEFVPEPSGALLALLASAGLGAICWTRRARYASRS